MHKQDDDLSFKDLFIPFTEHKAIVIIVVLGIILFFNSLFNGFVLDDIGQILNNNSIHSLSNVIDIFRNQIHAQEVSNYFRPVPIIFYTVIYSVFQENSFYFHLIQVLFHIFNSILILLILKKFLRQNVALIAALVFLVHPINEEAVVYIACLQDILFVFFGLLALYVLQNDSNKLRGVIYANLFLLFSFLSKETGILFYIICLLYLYLFDRKRFVFHSSISSIGVLLYATARFTSHVPFRNIPVVPIMRLSLPERAISIPMIVFYYIKTFFYPKDLAAAHAWTTHAFRMDSFFIPLAIDILFLAGLFLIFFRLAKKKTGKPALFFLAWFLLGIAMHLQIFPLDMTVADRFFYFPIIGLLALISLFLSGFTFPRYGRYLSIGLSIILLIALATRTFIRNVNWYNQTTLVTHDEHVENNDYLLELLKSTDLIQHGKFAEALPYAKKAANLYPQSWIAWGNIGLVYQSQGDYIHAKQAYLRSLSIANYHLAYENLALLLLKHDPPTNVRNFVIKANDILPTSEKLWYFRILVEYELKNSNDAIYAAKRYFSLKQDQESYLIYRSLLNNLPITFNNP